MIIYKKEILPGETAEVKIPVGRLPSDTSIAIRTFVWRSKKPGPTVLLMGGVHGDEINGVEIVRQAMKTGMLDKLKCGSVIAVPLVNVYGFINFSRDLPDGKDVNRSFPGSRTGSLAARVANTVAKEIIPNIDFGLDFHTGGNSLYNYPQIRYSRGNKASEELAKLFAPPVIIASTPIKKSLRLYALNQGKPIVVFEGGESLRMDGFSVHKGLEGIKRVLISKGMIEGKITPGKSIFFERSGWQRAPRSGIFEWTQNAGCYIRKGEPLGQIGGPYCKVQTTVYAKRDGFIFGHNNAPVVSLGDALFNIGFI